MSEVPGNMGAGDPPDDGGVIDTSLLDRIKAAQAKRAEAGAVQPEAVKPGAALVPATPAAAQPAWVKPVMIVGGLAAFGALIWAATRTAPAEFDEFADDAGVEEIDTEEEAKPKKRKRA